MLESILLLPRTALQPPGVATLSEGSKDPLHRVERAHARHAIAARFELARSLRTAQQQDGQHRQLLASQTEGFLGQVAILDRPTAMAAREPRKAVATQPGDGLAHGRIVVVRHRIAIG
jgi:hypothetical protein